MVRPKRKADFISLPPEEKRALEIAEVKETLEARQRAAVIRLRTAAAVETCHVALATNLLATKSDLRCSWREFADLLGNVVDHAYLFKVAARSSYFKKTTFDLVRRNLILVTREQLGMTIQIPLWQEYSGVTEKE